MTDEERAERDRKREECLRRMHERMLAPIRAMEPVLRMAREFAESPAAQIARDLAQSPAARIAREMGENLRVPRMPSLGRGLAGLDSPDLDRPTFKPIPMPPNYQAQLVEEVVELRGEVVELQEEMREVRESARRDAHRGRRQVVDRDKREARFKLWYVVLAAIITAVVSVLLA